MSGRTFFRKPATRADALEQLATKACTLARLNGWGPKDLARALASVPPAPPISSKQQWAKLSPVARAELELQMGVDPSDLPMADGKLDLPDPLRSLVSTGEVSEYEARQRFDASIARYEKYIAELQGETPRPPEGRRLGGVDAGRAAAEAIRDARLAGVGARQLLETYGRTPTLRIPETKEAYHALSGDAADLLATLLPDLDPSALSGGGMGRSAIDALSPELKAAVQDRRISLERAQKLMQGDVDGLNTFASAQSPPAEAPAPVEAPSPEQVQSQRDAFNRWQGERTAEARIAASGSESPSSSGAATPTRPSTVPAK
jgi:hypothetical protein